jgi:hypothetical protein
VNRNERQINLIKSKLKTLELWLVRYITVIFFSIISRIFGWLFLNTRWIMKKVTGDGVG